MKASTKARIWWAVHRWWHRIEMRRQGQDRTDPRLLIYQSAMDGWSLSTDIWWHWHHRRPLRAARAVLRALGHEIARLYWKARYHSGLGCAGGRRQLFTGHARTRICDWLEWNCARRWEDIAEARGEYRVRNNEPSPSDK